ncbi:MAG: helicase C-terminal domain-containing protein [Planctomycetota bacterium]|jgi:predicted DnaQ family exonuclease/DinG family helicase
MYKNVIAIDLETTGIDHSKHEIIEIGAAVFSDGEIVETFSELVCPQSPPPLEVQKLTGITPRMLEGARSIAEVFPEFMEFLEYEDSLCIAHNASFDRSFLRQASSNLFSHVMLDTVGLSRIVFPMLNSHSLAYLAEVFELERSEGHRALSDCITTLDLWKRLVKELQDFPLSLVDEINQLLSVHKTHPFTALFKKLKDSSFAENFGKDKESLSSLFFNFRDIIEKKKNVRELDEEHGHLDVKKVEEIFMPEGCIAEEIPAYESRHGQIDMAVSFADSLNSDRHFMVEAPTGIGKSLAYLVPAVLFSQQEDFPVIISTNTRNLQSQLFDNDIPILRKALNTDINCAIIKGRGNYLCLRKVFYVLDAMSRELDREERMQMVTMLNWARQTSTGDIAECILAGRPNFASLWSKLRTIGDECMGRQCRFFSKCFLKKARSLSLQADIVIANHALVFAEMNMESSVLPEYRHIVFDEAHNLEAAATDHLSVEIAFYRIMQVFNRLYRPAKRKKGGTGLAPSILGSLSADSCSVSDELAGMAEDRCEAIIKSVDASVRLVLPFFESMADVLPQKKGTAQVRFAEGMKRPSLWDAVTGSKEPLVSSMANIMRNAEALIDIFKEIQSGAVPYLREFQRELEGVTQWLKEIISDIEFVLAGSEANYVYWIESAQHKQGGACAKAAPLSIAELMNDQVYARKRSCAFCSATLTVRNNFKFLSGRLGIDRIADDRIIKMQAESPFDYDEQCLVAVPSFLPEPNYKGSEDYIHELSQLQGDIYRITQGRGMALFTSYHMLKTCYENLQEILKGDGLTILAQGQSASREHITAVFKRDIHSILLGTHSFWEGVDVAGEALSCLTIARLPFAVFTDPIIQARCEQLEAEGKDSFMHYSLPSAVIRFKQGFGRLIRSRSDRGVVVIADRRIISKRYGRIFIDSLPTQAETFKSAEDLLENVEDFFAE